MDTFQTSLCKPLNLAIDAQGQGLNIRELPRGRYFDRILVRLVGQDEREVASHDFSRTGEKYLPTGNLPDGEYSLEVFNPMGESGRLRGYIYNMDALVKIRSGRPTFSEPWCLQENLSVLRRLSRSPHTVRNLLQDDSQYPCNNPEVRRIAAIITAGLDDEYGKMLAIHDWVAENVFYDEDALRLAEHTLVALHRSTMDVLRTRRAVCQGYSDLAVSFLRACGIPSVSLGCFALAQGTQGGWENPENRVCRNNHAFTAALMGNRYVLMDITWDSDNIYSRGRYGHKTGLGRIRKYFDMSPMLFSASHRFIV